MFELPKDLHVTADWSEAVEVDDPRGAFVLGAKGRLISDDLARQLGLLKDSKPEEPAPVVEPIDATNSAVALASEYDIDLSTIKGTGASGRIVKSDVQAVINGAVTG